MLSLEECRKIDPSLSDLTDDELRSVRDDLYVLGELALDSYIEKTRKQNQAKNGTTS